MIRTGRPGYILIQTFAILLLLTLIHFYIQSHLTCYVEKGNYSPNNSQSVDEVNKLLCFDSLTELKHGDVLKIQKIWKEELSQVTLQGNNRYVTDQTMETGGTPERVMLITGWRSGSTYVGTELLKSRPGTYYFFEPLHNSYMNTAHEESEVRDAQRILGDLLNCRNPDGRHTTDNLGYGSFFSRSAALSSIAKKNNMTLDPTFNTVMCRKSPIMAMKVVGLRLRDTIPLLADEKLNLKVIYLVRDPRATISSRRRSSWFWCRNYSSCSNYQVFCSYLVEDFNAAQELQRDYSQRFMLLQYEDLITRSKTADRLSEFLNLSTNSSTALESAKDGTQLTKWIKGLGENMTLIQEIQGACAEAMDLWGYKPLETLPTSSSTWQ